MRTLGAALLLAVTLLSVEAHGQARTTVRLRITSQGQVSGKADAVTAAWLEPLNGSNPFPVRGHYTLLQKNRAFVPHAQVVPVGATVEFPNADPFFHNVFSLFDGRRFDLGLYEAGTSKSITFPREGVSYIFCNIHPEMSAVILTLDTPFFALSHINGVNEIQNVVPGAYTLHVWVEGVPQTSLSELSRNVQILPSATDLGTVVVNGPVKPATHLNKFGKPYAPESHATY